MKIKNCCLLSKNVIAQSFPINNTNLIEDKKKTKSYYIHVSFLLSFLVLIDFGETILSAGHKLSGVKNVQIDLDKREIYKAEKKIRELKSKIEPLKKYANKQVKAKTSKIIKELIILTSSEKYISAEIIASYLLYNYFCDTSHKFGIDSDFKYFANENTYYPILDRIIKTNLVNIKSINDKIFTVIKNNKHK